MTVRCIDIETTGTDLARDAIVEIGSVDLQRDKTITNFRETLVNPGVPVPPAASAVHHLIDADLATAPPLANGTLHVGDGARAEKLHGRAVQRCEQLVQVRIDQAWYDRFARKLDHLRVRTDVVGDRGVVADGEKTPVSDGDGLRDAPVLIDRDHLAAAQHEIGGLGEGRRCESKYDKERGEKPIIEAVTHGEPLTVQQNPQIL